MVLGHEIFHLRSRFRGSICAGSIGLAVVAALAAALSPVMAHADDVGIDVAPATAEMTLIPGAEVSEEITLINQSPHAVSVIASIDGYGEQTQDRSAVEWLRIEPRQLLLPGLKRRTVTVVIQVPDGDLPSGGHYAIGIFEAQSIDPLQDFGDTSSQANLSFFLDIEGKGPLVRQAAVDWFFPVLEPQGLIGFRARLENVGNVHFAVKGNVEIIGLDGEPTWTVEFPESMPILPTTGQVFVGDVPLPLAPGKAYNARALISYGETSVVTTDYPFTINPVLRVADLQPVHLPEDNLAFVVTLVNEGDVALMPASQVSVQSSDGMVLGTSFDTGPSLILPGKSGEVRFNFHQSLPSGDHVALAEIYYGIPNPVVYEKVFTSGKSEPARETGIGDNGPREGNDTGSKTEPGQGVDWRVPAGAAVSVLLLALIAMKSPLVTSLRSKLTSVSRSSRESGQE